jgi:polyhydroxyalkanoate synthase subunit PhaC
MAEKTSSGESPADLLADLMARQAEAAQALWGQFAAPDGPAAPVDPADAARWVEVAQKLQAMWLEFQSDQAMKAVSGEGAMAQMADPSRWLAMMEGWYARLPMARPDVQQKLWDDGLALWETVLGQMGIGPRAGAAEAADLPRRDKRFADARWRDNPYFALVHQTYLILSEQILAAAESVEGVDPEKQEQLRFATRALVEAFSPSNFALTNPAVVDRAIATKGESLVKGMEHLIADLKRGQLTHTDPQAFRLGENIAVTPGKVVFETPLFQLIQYTPVTDKVLDVPLVIFPPWINRFYILDLNPQKSFVRWAVEQGITVFMVSWRSADETMADVVWDDYIAAQIAAIDHVRERLKVPAVHTIGYCVAGTTLAATLAVLARKGQADKVKSATFFTAQVDFENAGDLLHFVDDAQIETIRQLSPQGYLDGRYMAATFNLLRGQDLIWSYVVNNYLLGQDYPAFDLLHWNGDVTNLPVKWHTAYLRDLYRDNRLATPDGLSALGVGIDLGLIRTPCYIQAGREDHIAPPESVWKFTRHVQGPHVFLLAGSGHIAGVVNPPSASKYQYWTNEAAPDSLDAFIAGATEHPGSWWPHWLGWLREQAPAEVPASGKRKPGGRGDSVIEDAPGRYVKTR